MFFPDLSSYSYLLPRGLLDVLNVGWLAASEPFSTGPVPPCFVEYLKWWMVVAKVNQTRGTHGCDFCSVNEQQPTISNTPLGSAEIWIPDQRGNVFAAPTLVIHYVEAHRYRPPEQFITAVMNRDPAINWNANEEFERRTGVAFL